MTNENPIVHDIGLWGLPLNKKLLLETTCYLAQEDLKSIRWKNVRHIHILSQDGEPSLSKLTDKKVRPGYYMNKTGQWLLLLGVTEEEILHAVKSCGRKLEKLDVRFTRIKELDISHLVNLETVWLGGSDALSEVDGLESLREIRELSLYGVRFLTVLDICGYDNLEKLKLNESSIRRIRIDHMLPSMKMFWAYKSKLRDADCVRFFPNVERMSLAGSEVTRLPDLSGFTELRTLYIDCLQVSNWESLVLPAQITELNLSNTNLRKLPESIRNMRALKRLDLNQLELDELPDWLPELGLEFSTIQLQGGIRLWTTTVKDMEMSVFDQPQDMILRWFAERKGGNDVFLNEIKVVFLGNGEVGKSHTIERLLNDGGEPSVSFTGAATPGIAIQNKKYTIDGQTVQIHFWDFGGQEILYSMHRMFLTKRTLYVILVDARNESKGNQAREWLDTVGSFAGDAPVLLVVNKTDQNPSASIDEEDLRRKYSGLRKVVFMSALKATKDEFNSIFTQSMLELIRQSDFLKVKWPRKWTRVKASIQDMHSPYIFSDAYERLCRECDVNENQIDLLEWFNDLGISFCQCRDYNLREYVILKPEWITNAIYTILFNKHEEVENGMISLREINALLNPCADDGERIRRVLPDAAYTWQETNYVLDVVRKFRLSYSVNRNVEFFPMLCRENTKPVAQEYADASDTLEFRMQFTYLPNNVLHRLMVERWAELDTDNVWLTGARFAQPNTGLSAVVRIDGNELQIYVRSENNLHAPNTYLSVIEGSVERIRQELKLPQPRKRLVYKVGDQKTEFDYARLLKMHAKGKETEYSDELDEDIPIRDILTQAAPSEATEQERLLADLVKACGQLQADIHYCGTKENARNTYIRNALDNMGYIVRDQHLSGVSGGESEEGELDLDIRKYADIPWTICEAMRVNSSSKTDWNFHLKKLLNNYNSNGLRFLILLTYVDDEKDKFDRIWNSFREHIQGHGEGHFACQANSFRHYQTQSWTGNHYIQTARCSYVLDDYTPTVYHVFVRMGR